MTRDLNSDAAATERIVVEPTDDSPAHVVEVSRSLPGSPGLLWFTLTDPQGPGVLLCLPADLTVGARYENGDLTGVVTHVERERSFRATWILLDVESVVTVTLAPERSGRTRLRLRHEWPKSEEPWQWPWTRWGAVLVMRDVVLHAMERVHTPGIGFPMEGVLSFINSPDALEYQRLSCLAWGRAAIAGGVDEGRAALMANIAWADIDPTPRPHEDRLVAEGAVMSVQHEVAGYIAGESPDVQRERAACLPALLASAAAIIREDFRRRGVALGEPSFTEDARRLVPFKWFQDRQPLGRFEMGPPEPYRILKEDEYIVVALSFPAEGADEAVTLQLPVRQRGKVFRDETRRLDNVEMCWSIPPVALGLVEFVESLPLHVTVNRAADEQYKITFRDHLGFSPDLYTLAVRPVVARSYAMKRG